jgi:hypothetical protein
MLLHLSRFQIEIGGKTTRPDQSVQAHQLGPARDQRAGSRGPPGRLRPVDRRRPQRHTRRKRRGHPLRGWRVHPGHRLGDHGGPERGDHGRRRRPVRAGRIRRVFDDSPGTTSVSGRGDVSRPDDGEAKWMSLSVMACVVRHHVRAVTPAFSESFISLAAGSGTEGQTRLRLSRPGPARPGPDPPVGNRADPSDRDRSGRPTFGPKSVLPPIPWNRPMIRHGHPIIPHDAARR